jgi:hypothetical protein
MWASMATQDPKIIAALVSRGADVNDVVAKQNRTLFVETIQS